MQCMNCDGTGRRPVDPWLPESDEPCPACKGSGIGPDDEYEQKLREAVSKLGMVYVIRDDTNARVKIGTALNPLTRLRDLQTGSSTRLRLIAIIPGGRRGEQGLHATWVERRLDGEWFDDADRQISRIMIWSARSGNGIVWPQP